MMPRFARGSRIGLVWDPTPPSARNPPVSGQQSAPASEQGGILWNKGLSEYHAPAASLSARRSNNLKTTGVPSRSLFLPSKFILQPLKPLLDLLGKNDVVLQQRQDVRDGTERFDSGFKTAQDIGFFNRR